MTTRVLSVVDTAYRGTVEEQDDTILWLLSMCSTAGLDAGVLLQGNAVNYGVRGQDASGLRFGTAASAHPPKLDEDLEALLAKGVAVHYVAEDVEERGISESKLVAGMKPVRRGDIADLFGRFDQIWHW